MCVRMCGVRVTDMCVSMRCVLDTVCVICVCVWCVCCVCVAYVVYVCFVYMV